MLIWSSVAEFLPGFQDRVREALKILLGEEGTARVRMGLAKDGSGVGGMSCLLSFSRPFPSLPLCSLSSHSPSNCKEWYWWLAALTALQAKKALDKRTKDETEKGCKEVPGQKESNRS
jgi:hypothetical protein